MKRISNKLSTILTTTFESKAELGLFEAFYSFIAEKHRQNLEERTLNDHKSHFNYFFQYLCQYRPQTKKIKDLTIEDIRGYIDFMQNKHAWDNHPSAALRKKTKTLSPTTINIRLRTLRCQLNYWYKEGMIQDDIASKISLLKTDKKFRPLEHEDVSRLIAVIEHYKKYSELRNYVIILLLADLGIRISQLLSTKQSDVNLNNNSIYIGPEDAKDRRAHTYFFNEVIKQPLLRLIRENQAQGVTSEYLFINTATGQKIDSSAFRKSLSRYRTKAAIKKSISPHDFRHYFARTFIQAGGSIEELQIQLNHESIQTTKDYAKSLEVEVPNKNLFFSPIKYLFGGSNKQVV